MAGHLGPHALQRLQRDLKELYREPLPGIQVHVDPCNISLMCLLLTPLEGPHTGFPLHLCIAIPASYPHQPPRVSIQTPISGHPNIFDSYICCDILRPRPETLRRRRSIYRSISTDSDTESESETDMSNYMGGYTPAYLLKYIFLQLLTFFSASHIEQEYGGYLSQRNFLPPNTRCSFSCNKCGFNTHPRVTEVPKKVNWKIAYSPSFRKEFLAKLRKRPANGCGSAPQGLPSLKEAEVATIEAGVQGSLNEDCLHMLNDHVWLIIFDHLSDHDLVHLGRASPTVAKDVMHRYNIVLMRELVWFFTRKTYREALLGVGVLKMEPLPYTKEVLHIEAFDLLSLEAYETENVRESIWGHTFTHFLPLALDDEHFMRALPALLKFLANVGLTVDMSPTGFLDVIPKLMNTMIVNIMAECDSLFTGINHPSNESAPRKSILQASEKALKGYCLLFHLLMKLSSRFPEIKAKVQEKFAIFLSGKEARNKKSIPDLGEFVAVLPLVLEEGYDWATVSSNLVEELFTRNVLWVLKKNPKLVDLGKTRYKEPIISPRRGLEETFEASQTGLRLMLLQANFMRALVKWKNKLNETYGFPPSGLPACLVELVKRIYGVKVERRDPYVAWKDFFTILHYKPIPSMYDTVEMLKTAVLDSKSKGYHYGNQGFRQKRTHHTAFGF